VDCAGRGCAEGLFQRLDMSAGGRLGQTQSTGGGRQGAGLDNGKKGSVVIPADLINGHSFLYID
jgi:hypothetical protein